MSNRHKLLFALGAAALTVMALLAHLIWSGYREAIHAAEAKTKDYAAILEARLDATLRRADAELQLLARTTPVAALDQDAVSGNAQVDAMLKSSLINFPELAGLSIFDVNGNMLYRSIDSPLRPNISDRSHFRMVRDNPQAGLVISEVIVVRDTSRPSVVLAKALRDKQGVFRGVVTALIELEYFQKLFQSLDVGANGNIAVYRSDDFTQVLRWPPVERKLNVALPLDSPARTALAEGNKAATFQLASAADNRVRIYSRHALHPYPFFVAVGVARDEVLAGWRTRSLVVGLSTLLLVGLLIGLLHRLGRADTARTQLAAIVENSNDAIFSRSLDGTILSWNAGSERMLGYTAAEAIGKPAWFCVPPGRPRNMADNNERMLRGEVVARESDRITKDGRKIDVLTSHSPIRDGAGNVVGASVILQDITALKQAQAAVKDSEERFRATFEQAAIGIAHIEVGTYRILMANDKYCNLLGYTRAELIGTDSRALTPPDDLPARDDERARLLAGELRTSIVERPLIRKDGTRQWFSRSLSLVRDTAGQQAYFISVLEDISARKQTEAMRTQLAAIIEHSNDAIYSRNLDGTILSWNAGAEKILGYTAAEAIGKPGDFIVPPGRPSNLTQNNEKLLRGERVAHETDRMTKDGRVIAVLISQSPIRDSAGNIVGASIILQDITALKQSEEARSRLAAVAEGSNDAIFIRDGKGLIVYWNDSASRLYGYSSAEVMGKDSAFLVPPELLAERARNRAILQHGGVVANYETVRLRKDGTCVEVSIGVSAVKDHSGKMIGTATIARDITERKQAEAARTLLAAIIEHSNDAIFSRALDGTILSWNAGAEKMLGYTAAEAIGKPISFTLPPGQPPNLAQNNARVLRGEVVVRESDRMTRDGRVIPVLTSHSPIRGNAGSITGVSVILQDITALKQAQAAVKESEERFRATFEQAAVGIAHFDLQHRNIKANRRYCEIVGYPPEELLSKAPGFLTHPDDINKERSDEQRSQLLSGAIDHFSQERRYLHKDGTVVWVTRTESLARDASGQPMYFIRVVEDITDRKEVEERYRATFDNAPVGIMHTAVEGYAILRANRKLCEMLGYTQDELLRMTSTDIVHPDYRFTDQSRYKNQMLRDEFPAYSSERKLLRKDGSSIWVNRTVSLVHDASGKPLYFIRIVEDITERKQAEAARASLEAQLRESQKMQAIGTLAGGIAHDFNNIIAIILGNVELARQDAGHNPPALESLERIQGAGERARDLVRQILAFSRRQPTARQPISLAPVVEQTARLLRATLPARLSLEVHCDPEAPPVLADATHIQQALINLATNAMQAMPSGPGRIGIRLDSVILDAPLVQAHPALRALHALHPGRTVRLAVSDNGTGMDAATRSRIFEPFFTTKPVGEGTGLGLSVVHGIVEGHEGVIEVDSQPGQGARFTLYFPASEINKGSEEAAANHSITQSPNLAGGAHVLYIDDDADLVFLVKCLLERRGCRVSAYTDVQEALTALRAAPAGFDLVLSDYNMPQMSGLDVAREVRTIRAALPVAVTSGFIDETLQAQAAAAGVRELIFKADSVEAFCETVQRLAKGLFKG